MRGREFSSDGTLPERDLYELTDLLAMRLYRNMGRRVYRLSRQDVAELIEPYTEDLSHQDRCDIPWLVWDLLQEGAEIELQAR